MSEHSHESSFAKVFIPGLIVGLLVGMAIGAFIPPLMDRAPQLNTPVTRGGSSGTPTERDARPSTPPAPRDGEAPPSTTETKPAETKPPEVKPDAKPENKPAPKADSKPAAHP